MSAKNLRILLLLENAGAGSGRHVIDLCRGLTTRGHRVTLIYSQSRQEDWFPEAAAQIDGLETHCVHMVRSPGPYDLISLVRIIRFARKFGPWDIVHGHSSKGGALARLSAPFFRASSIYTPHAMVTLDPELTGVKRKLFTTIERLLSYFSGGIICVSRAERDHAKSLGIAERRLTVIENCLAPLPAADRASARATLLLNDQDICVGTVGRLAPQKNIARLLRSFALVLNKAPRAKLAIVGDGPDKQMLQALAADLKLDSAVVWTGHADGPALMAGFDVFALSSDYEAFPYVLLEAAARALPIVSTRVGGAEDVIRDGVNGYVVDSGIELAERLLGLIHDDVKRAAMSANSLERSGAYNIDRMVSETLDYYREVLD